MKLTVWKKRVEKECKEKRRLARLRKGLRQDAPVKKEARDEND